MLSILLISGLQNILRRTQNGKEFANQEQRAGYQDRIAETIGYAQRLLSGSALGRSKMLRHEGFDLGGRRGALAANRDDQETGRHHAQHRDHPFQIFVTEPSENDGGFL